MLDYTTGLIPPEGPTSIARIDGPLHRDAEGGNVTKVITVRVLVTDASGHTFEAVTTLKGAELAVMTEQGEEDGLSPAEVVIDILEFWLSNTVEANHLFPNG